MSSEDVFHENFDCDFNDDVFIRDFARDVMTLLDQSINECANIIVFIKFKKINDEV